jgi:mannose-6-phosphate isomerase-like protein (cupin superfamily)
MNKINLLDKFASFEAAWEPKIVAALNGQHVKLVRCRGEFMWHHHETEDELFLVIEGELMIEFQDRAVTLGPGELVVVPRGVEHRPVARVEALVLLLEPQTTRNTGETTNARTVQDPEWI